MRNAARSLSIVMTVTTALVLAGCSSTARTSPTSTPAVTDAAGTVSTAISVAPSATPPPQPSDPATSTTVAETTTAESPATTAGVAESTTADPRPINSVDEALAVAGTLQAADFGPAWSVYAPAQPRALDTSSCSYRPDGAVTLVDNGGFQGGPTMQLGSAVAYVNSYAITFPSEPLAMEYIGVVSTDVWATCRAAQIQHETVDPNSPDVVTVTTRDAPNLHTSGFESYAQFEYKQPDGSTSGVNETSFYRLGRTVISVSKQYGSLNDADTASFTKDPYTALSAAYARVGAIS